MQLDIGVILLNLGKVLSSDYQDQRRASAADYVGNTYGASTGLLRTQAVCSGATLQAQNPAPPPNRAGGYFQHAE